MSINKLIGYRSISFCAETNRTDFYTYANIKDLTTQCERSPEEIIYRMTLGVLQSEHGKFWLADIDVNGVQSESRIRVSTMYLKSLPQTTVLSYPVQVFGTVQWRNGTVIFPTILQVLTVPNAIRKKDILDKIAATHLASHYKETSLQDEPT